ncbi:helix-turn-helix domain-containing protein [uncultured Flavobacterium sp.]|uniref:helix-turn-helix domain-containing protein n=1 Tax=uncultured Flavobacterium sp. TaxID=165435 RepID=UPI0025CF14B4|nr:helix-turn-helix domain-containing protein [uncultured Flavobacterium sp.]
MEKIKKICKPKITLALNMLLNPLSEKIDKIDKLLNSHGLKPRYYRNEDLKRIFGLSTNTIVKYRQTGILPYTKIGDIFLYEAKKIDKILRDNEV